MKNMMQLFHNTNCMYNELAFLKSKERDSWKSNPIKYCVTYNPQYPKKFMQLLILQKLKIKKKREKRKTIHEN